MRSGLLLPLVSCDPSANPNSSKSGGGAKASSMEQSAKITAKRITLALDTIVNLRNGCWPYILWWAYKAQLFGHVEERRS